MTTNPTIHELNRDIDRAKEWMQTDGLLADYWAHWWTMQRLAVAHPNGEGIIQTVIDIRESLTEMEREWRACANSLDLSRPLDEQRVEHPEGIHADDWRVVIGLAEDRRREETAAEEAQE
jgi:hypothetical protein